VYQVPKNSQVSTAALELAEEVLLTESASQAAEPPRMLRWGEEMGKK
jgi:hypothetical protein